MMNLITFLPIVVLLIGMIIVFLLLRSNVSLFGWVNGKRAYIMMGIYMAILFIAAGVYVFGPKVETGKEVEEAHEQGLENIDGAVFDIIEGEQSIDILDDYIKDHDMMPYESNALSIQVLRDEYLTGYVLIEEIEDLKGNIEVTTYEPPQYASGIDVSDLFEHVSFRLEDETLTIESPYQNTEVTVNHLKPEFVFDQFMKRSESRPDQVVQDQHGIELNSDLLYIQVPKDITIDLGPYVDQVNIIK